MNKLNPYLARLSNAIEEENGTKLATLLSISDDHIYTVGRHVEKVNYHLTTPQPKQAAQYSRSHKVHDLNSMLSNRFDKTWVDVIVNHLKIADLLSKPYVPDPEELASLQNTAAQCVTTTLPTVPI